MCFPPFNLNNCWMLKTELLPISFGSFSSEDFMGTHTHTWQTITAGKKQKSPFLPKYQRRGISWSSLLKPREEVRKEKNCVLKQGLSPLRSVMAKQNTEEKTPRDVADPAHHQSEQVDMASSTAIELQAYPDHTHYSRILYSKDFQLHFSPFCNAGKRHWLASGRRGALLLVCLKHRSASLFPKERALPKAIGCHNRSALRPWVNICARCLFELL